MTKLQAIWNSVCSSTTLAAAGGAFISAQYGSTTGTVGFVIAGLIGSIGKYRTLTSPQETLQKDNWLVRWIFHRASTPTLLCAAAFANLYNSIDNLIENTPKATPEEILLTDAPQALFWLLATIADGVQIYQDNKNFRHSREITPAQSSDSISLNPTLYYNMCSASMAFVLADKQNVFSIHNGVASLVFASAIAAIYHGINSD